MKAKNNFLGTLNLLIEGECDAIHIINYGIDPQLRLSRSIGDIVHINTDSFKLDCVNILLENLSSNHEAPVIQKSELEKMSSSEERRFLKKGRLFSISRYGDQLSIDQLKMQNRGGAIGSEPDEIVWLPISARCEELYMALGISVGVD